VSEGILQQVSYVANSDELTKVFVDYYPKVTATVKKRLGNDGDWEDVVGMIFLDLCKEVLSAKFKGGCSLATMLYVITQRRIADRFRQRYKDDKVFTRCMLEVPTYGRGEGGFVGRTPSSRAGISEFYGALLKQSPRNQNLLEDYFENGLSRIDLTERYGLSLSRVSSIISRFLHVITRGREGSSGN
jgi:RNA polymerase sigma factor (sigma-70 family)